MMKPPSIGARAPTAHQRPFTRLCVPLLLLLFVGWLSASAGGLPEQTPPSAERAARDLFNHTVKNFHLPSAEARGKQKDQLLSEAAAGYQQLLKKYPEQIRWCAQAWHSLGNVRATQGQLPEALKIYSQIEKKYPTEDWEILQAWKSAGDLLWDARRFAEAKEYYQKIVKRFDTADATPIIKATVKGAQKRLKEKHSSSKTHPSDEE